jgi:4-hydroxybenzoate polyprenyltransferase
VIPNPASKRSTLRYLTWLRIQDILVLQGSPLLGAAFAVHHAQAADAGSIATLLTGNVLLMTHVFMLNDRAGLHADLADPNKAEHVFTARGVGPAELSALSTGLLLVSLLLFSRLGPTPVGLALAIAILSALYSLPRFHWKGRPILNSATHVGGGIVHFLLGYTIAHPLDMRGIAIASFFALVFAAGHLMQEIRDHEGDAQNGIRTNAVRFGPRRTFFASLGLFTIAQGLFLTLSLSGVLPRPLALVVLLYPIQLWWSFRAFREGLGYMSISRLQTRYRALYALIGIAIVAALFLR